MKGAADASKTDVISFARGTVVALHYRIDAPSERMQLALGPKSNAVCPADS